MITIDSTSICDLPVSREQMGFPKEGDRGNAVLLLSREMRPTSRAAYQQAGCIHEGACITSCDDAVLTVLEQLQLRYCPWPDRGFTLVVLDHALLGMIADRLVVASLMASEQEEEEA